MQSIDIQINKAVIESFSVELSDEIPKVSITIGLFTENGQKITTYSISTDNWNENNKFDLPMGMIKPILEIMKQLEVEATRHCKKDQLSLGE